MIRETEIMNWSMLNDIDVRHSNIFADHSALPVNQAI